MKTDFSKTTKIAGDEIKVNVLTFSLFKDFFKASKEKVTINKLYIKIYILISRRYFAASNSKRQV